MKRVKAACILQTLVFQQKDANLFSRDRVVAMNREEIDKYKASLEKNKTRYRIDEESEQEDGAIILRVRKQYNYTADVGEYFE